MLKKVRIRILSDRYRVEGSLFEGGAVSEPRVPEAPEHAEMCVEGNYLDNGSRVSITYKESELTGLTGSVATVSFQKSEPGVISMLRSGSVKTALVFERGRRHHCVYQTPIMPFDVCVHTARVENALEGAGTLLLDYTVEIRGADPERTRMQLSLLPVFDAPQGDKQ